MIKAIITDIEGTTTDIKFVHQVLFPYSRQHMSDFIQAHQNDPNIQAVIAQIRQEMHNPDACLGKVTQQLIDWIDQDKKIAPLKTIQGYIWQQGFEQHHYMGHVYADAHARLKEWQAAGIDLYVYSSGSVQAQKLLFQYTEFGDLRPLFKGYFDTQVGGKKEAASYAQILHLINQPGAQVLFLSDVIEELNAARDNQIKTVLLNRDRQTHAPHGHQEVDRFDEINIKEYV